ncbi:hypothetical protein ACQ4PT_010290 [Festuca glaucescens]
MENAAFASGAAMASSPVQAYPGGTMRVLAVEEDPACLTALTQMLQRHGYQVTAKASLDEALGAVRDNPEGFDLVMTVVRTQGPGIDGFELLKHAAQRCPVVLFSEVEPAETKMRGMLGGACAFLTKPLRDEEVRDIWQHVVARRRLSAASGAEATADARSSDVVVRQDEAARKRGLDDSGEGASDGRTTKKNKLNSSSETELHAAFVKAAEQLRGTEAYTV